MGMAVSFTDGSGLSAAELTIALIMGISKRLHMRHHAVTQGRWQIGPSTSLQGKHLGILGLGRIGSQVAKFGTLMGMEVLSWGPT
jgi:phosphoglycerate dehydrogenase-like enzyme